MEDLTTIGGFSGIIGLMVLKELREIITNKRNGKSMVPPKGACAEQLLPCVKDGDGVPVTATVKDNNRILDKLTDIQQKQVKLLESILTEIKR